jgi:hypothetical protein
MTVPGPYGSVECNVGAPDYTYSVTLQTTASTGNEASNVAEVAFRYQDANNYYAIVAEKNGVVELAKMQNGQWRPMLAYATTGTNTFSANDYSVGVSGSSISVKVNGKSVIQYTDPAAIQSGGVGVVNNNSSASISKVNVTPNN